MISVAGYLVPVLRLCSGEYLSNVGNCLASSDDPEQFRTLLAYSPLHTLRAGVAYPATLITTGDHDDRVFPAHSYKFAAALQQAQGGEAPVLLRVETKAGHGAGKPTAKMIEEVTDRYAFLSRVLGLGTGDGAVS